MDQLRLEGWKQCIMAVQQNRRTGEYDSQRVSVARRGAQCRLHVSPAEIAKNDGVPVCNNHLPLYRQALEAAAEKRAELRAKYDPNYQPGTP